MGRPGGTKKGKGNGMSSNNNKKVANRVLTAKRNGSEKSKNTVIKSPKGKVNEWVQARIQELDSSLSRIRNEKSHVINNDRSNTLTLNHETCLSSLDDLTDEKVSQGSFASEPKLNNNKNLDEVKSSKSEVFEELLMPVVGGGWD